MKKGNALFLILFVSIFAFSLYALEKQGTPLVKKVKPVLEKESCCQQDKSTPAITQPASSPLQAKGEKKEGAVSEKKQPVSEKGAPAEEVKRKKKGEEEEKGLAGEEEEEEEGEEEFEEYGEEIDPEGDEDVDFQTY